MVLASFPDDTFSMASLFPTRHTPLRPRVLLVIHLLPLAVPPRSTNHLHNFTPAKAVLLHAFQPLNLNLHVISMARIFSIISSDCNSSHHFSLLRRVRVPILDCYRSAERVFSVRRKLPDGVVELQSTVPRRCAIAAFH